MCVYEGMCVYASFPHAWVSVCGSSASSAICMHAVMVCPRVGV